MGRPGRLRFAVGPPRFPDAALRFAPGPRTGEPSCVGHFLVLPPVVLYAHVAPCLALHRLPASWLSGDDQNHLLRARLRERGARCHPAVGLGRGGWLAPGEESTPPSGRRLSAALDPGHGRSSRDALQDPASGTLFRFPISLAIPPMGFLTSAAQLRGHSIDQRSANLTGSRITTESGNLDGHRFVDQIGAAVQNRRTPPHEGSCSTQHRPADGISYIKPSSTSRTRTATRWEISPQPTRIGCSIGDIPANQSRTIVRWEISALVTRLWAWSARCGFRWGVLSRSGPTRPASTAGALIRRPSVRRGEPAWRQVRCGVCVEDDRGTRKDDSSPKSGAMRAA